jgi:hypothetical protein
MVRRPGGLELPAPSLRPGRLNYELLCSSPEEQQHRRLKADISWLALTGRSSLDRTVKQVMERAVQVITVYKKGSRVGACKGSFRTGQLGAIQNQEDWCVWASHAAMGVGTRTDLIRGLKQQLDSIRLMADGVVPLDPGCPVGPSRR